MTTTNCCENLHVVYNNTHHHLRRTLHCNESGLINFETNVGRNITDDALFRPATRLSVIDSKTLSMQAVAIIVKQRTLAIGLDASKFTGHSLGLDWWRVQHKLA